MQQLPAPAVSALLRAQHPAVLDAVLGPLSDDGRTTCATCRRRNTISGGGCGEWVHSCAAAHLLERPETASTAAAIRRRSDRGTRGGSGTSRSREDGSGLRKQLATQHTAAATFPSAPVQQEPAADGAVECSTPSYFVNRRRSRGTAPLVPVGSAGSAAAFGGPRVALTVHRAAS